MNKFYNQLNQGEKQIFNNAISNVLNKKSEFKSLDDELAFDYFNTYFISQKLSLQTIKKKLNHTKNHQLVIFSVVGKLKVLCENFNEKISVEEYKKFFSIE